MIAVAIDGPAGAGKSTIARAAASELGYTYVDTGAIYRTIGLFALERGIPPDDAEKLSPLLGNINLELKYTNGEQRIFLDGEDVSEKIRLPEMGEAASKVSAIPQVREFFLNLQRNLAKQYNVIMDGRDIGTVVLPNANVKIFLTASPEVRAMRRYKEHVAKGSDVSYNMILEEICTRDNRDSNRDIAPLKQAEDAVLADTSELNFDQSVKLILDIIKGGIA